MTRKIYTSLFLPPRSRIDEKYECNGAKTRQKEGKLLRQTTPRVDEVFFFDPDSPIPEIPKQQILI